MHGLRLIILFGLLLTAACGFEPLYGNGPGQVRPAAFAQIEISSIAERNGQYLRQEIIDRLQPHGASAKPLYVLAVGTVEAKGDQTISKDATVTRSFIRQTANYTLTDKRTGKTLIARQLISSNSYNNLFSEFGTIVTEEDARQRSLHEIAERLTQQLSAYFAHPMKQKNPGLPPAKTKF